MFPTMFSRLQGCSWFERLEIVSLFLFLLTFSLNIRLFAHSFAPMSFTGSFTVFNDFTDISVFLWEIPLLVLVLIKLLEHTRQVESIYRQKFHVKHFVLIVTLSIYALFKVISSDNLLLSLFSLLRFSEYIFIVILIYRFISRETYLASFFCSTWNKFLFLFLPIIVVTIFSSFLSIAQFSLQESVGIPYLESNFSRETSGSAKADLSFFGLGDVLRPYGLFLHPNIFSFYLFSAAILLYISHIILFHMKQTKQSVELFPVKLLMLFLPISFVMAGSRSAFFAVIVISTVLHASRVKLGLSESDLMIHVKHFPSYRFLVPLQFLWKLFLSGILKVISSISLHVKQLSFSGIVICWWLKVIRSLKTVFILLHVKHFDRKIASIVAKSKMLMFPVKHLQRLSLIISRETFAFVLVTAALFFFLQFFIGGLLQSAGERMDILSSTWNIFRNNILFGVDFGHQVYLLNQDGGGLLFWQYQPVHNAILYLIFEFGYFGSVLIYLISRETWRIYFMKTKSITKIVSRETFLGLEVIERGLSYIVFYIIIVSQADHYFITVEQGAVLTAILLGAHFGAYQLRQQFQENRENV